MGPFAAKLESGEQTVVKFIVPKAEEIPISSMGLVKDEVKEEVKEVVVELSEIEKLKVEYSKLILDVSYNEALKKIQAAEKRYRLL